MSNFSLKYFLLQFVLWIIVAIISANESLPKDVRLVIAINATYSVTLNLKEKAGEIEIASEDNKDHDADHIARYRDDQYDALFSVLSIEGKNGFSYMGNFYVDNQEYGVFPVSYDTNALKETALEKKEINIDGKKYSLLKMAPRPSIKFGDDEVTLPDVTDQPNDADKISRQMKGKQDLVMELLVVIDHTTYRKFLDFTKNNAGMAVDQIKYYYSHLFNAVNDNYQRIKSSEYKIGAAVVALQIAKTPYDAPFTSRGDITAGPNRIYTDRALLALYHWSRDSSVIRQNKWPRFDIAVLFHEQLSATEILGLSYIGTLCKGTTAVTVQNLPIHEKIYVTTHEIGHALGSWHDGEKNKCSSSDSYIMASASFGRSTDYHNEKVFSHCTVEQFTGHIRELNNNRTNCLLDKPSGKDVLDEKKNRNTITGQKYSLMEQCKFSFGRSSYFCGGMTMGNDICSDVVCFNPGSNMCEPYWRIRAYEGTSCGEKMWCVSGRCVKDNKAPSFKETCKFGDSKAPLQHYSMKNLKCSDIYSKYNTFCYQELYSKPCCESCAKLKKKNPANCPYGDKEENCKQDHCNSPSYRERCCKTCSRPDSDGCYGSGPSWCSKKKAFDCYTPSVAKSCCSRCNSLKVSPVKGCEFGDKADWCSSEIRSNPSSCKEADIKPICCYSCR